MFGLRCKVIMRQHVANRKEVRARESVYIFQLMHSNFTKTE